MIIALTFLTTVSCSSKINLKNYLQGGMWCGYSELSEGELCIEFMGKDAYLKVKNEFFFNPLPYVIRKIDEEKQIITWEFVGEGTLNEFFIISQDTINFKQKGATKFAKFVRREKVY